MPPRERMGESGIGRWLWRHVLRISQWRLTPSGMDGVRESNQSVPQSKGVIEPLMNGICEDGKYGKSLFSDVLHLCLSEFIFG